MSTLSSRLGLTVPEAGDSMALADNMLSDNYDNIDLNCHCRLVANQAAVTAPFNGQHIRSAADTANFVRKNGVWVNTNTPISNLTPFKGNANTTTAVAFTTSELKLIEFTFNATVGRRYLVHASIDYDSTDTVTTNEITQRIRYATGSSVTTSGTLLHSKIFIRVQNNGPFGTVIEFFPNATAQYTIGVFALRSAGSNTITASADSTNSVILVMDWGA